MTDELRVALVAVALSQGQSFGDASELVDQVAGEMAGASTRAVLEAVAARAHADSWGTLRPTR